MIWAFVDYENVGLEGPSGRYPGEMDDIWFKCDYIEDIG